MIVEAGEECDDGNDVDADGCDATTAPTNGLRRRLHERSTGEQCDDGNDDNADACQANGCLDAVCGDGEVNNGEALRRRQRRV